jgi:hypothetical protein
MEQLLTQSTVDYLTDLKDIIKYFTNDTNRQFAEIMNHVKMLYDLYKNGMGGLVQKLEPKILINSIYKNNELGKKMTYDEYGVYIGRYRGEITDDIIMMKYENEGWKYSFWKALSHKILCRQIANIKNSYLDIYQKLPYTMNMILGNINFDKKTSGNINGSKGMCHYFIICIELDFSKNIYTPEPNIKLVKTGWFSSKPKEPERPKYGYTQVATDEDIYIEMKKLL